ncbi:hypothetical protein [Pontibacter harenae]|uniref:hypothetical protein n=1 Tax=Pontibacter harenae TaxID=2894083 RepID=UPI001E2F9268|nr:hypothetical protein [Pontibacter harenae]MCC9168056.1 hypothetical protein [Pontibacter harenae]
MKKTIKLAFAAFAFVAFTACGSENNSATEAETTTPMENEMDSDMNMGNDLENDTTTVQDTTVNDGLGDSVPEQEIQ